MSHTATIKKFVDAISQIKRSGDYCATGELEVSDPGLTITGVGPVRLPLRPADVRALADAAQQAPYGKGSRTIIDTAVRDTLEVASEHVELAAEFSQAVKTAVRRAAEVLGLPEDGLRPELYKLLVYQKGGFFLPHRDNEKQRGMVASMIVVLPSKFRGGELVVRHEQRQKVLSFDDARDANAAQYALFYADCVHEVRKVISGVRVCLAYNLIMTPARRRGSTAKQMSGTDPHLLQAVNQWMEQRGSDPMVFALEHQYTQSGLKPTLLKGADREVFDQLAAVSQQSRCRLHLGQVSRHLSQAAYDDDFGYASRRYRDTPVSIDNLEIGEVYEDEILVDAWKSEQGKPVAMGTLACDGSMLISTTPVDQWKPTQQDYEGYTGNAGNVLERWYHKSAIVLWSEQQHFDVIAKMGLREAVGTLLAMRAELFTLPDDELEQACDDCQSLAEAIIDHWPHRLHDYLNDDTRTAWLTDFADELPKFDDPDLVEKFLLMLAQRDWTLKIDPFVMTSCRRMGAEAIAPLLLQFIQTEPAPNRYGQRSAKGLPTRDAAWINRLCQDRDHGGLSHAAVSELLDVAIERLIRQAEPAESQWLHRDEKLGDTWLLLCKATLSLRDEHASERLFGLATKNPSAFDLRTSQVPAAGKLHAWASKHFEMLPRPVSEWIQWVRQQLEKATSAMPMPPTTFARRADTECDCRFCQQLKGFLSDPTLPAARIAARQDRREHLEYVIRVRRLDVSHTLDCSTRPYALVLTKTTATHARQLQQYQQDLELLASLPNV